MDLARLRRRAPAFALAAFALIGVLGIAAFLLSMRPCRFTVDAGQELVYDLVVTMHEETAEGVRGPARTQSSRVRIIGVGDGTIVQVHEAPGRPAAVHRLRLTPDGAMRRTGGPATAPGAAIERFFDFNLMPLPSGNEQAWTAPVAWAAVPVAVPPAKVKRMRSGAAPEFRLTLPRAVEWVLDATRGYGQVRDVAMAWRFNTVSGRPEHARLTLTTATEPPPGQAQRRLGYEFVLSLASSGTTDPGPWVRQAR
jgi:hypothetical protein